MKKPKGAKRGEPERGGGGRKSPSRASAPGVARSDKTPSKKAPSRKAPTEKAPSRKASTEKAPSRKASTEKAPSKKAPSKKAPSRKAPSRKAPTKKAPTEKAPTKKAPTEKAPRETAQEVIGSDGNKAKKALGLKVLRNAMTPFTDERGKPLHFAPYRPVLGACDICPARCCRLTVKLSLPDAVEFCHVLGVPFAAALNFVPSEGERSFRLDAEGDPRLSIRASQFRGRVEIALKRREDGSCGYLFQIDGYERCGAYLVRPSTCRLYPLSWTSDFARGGPHVIMCPVPYAVTPQVEEAFCLDAARSLQRWAIHDQILARWESRQEEDDWSIDQFLEFALPPAAEEMGIDPVPILDLRSAGERLFDVMVKSGVIPMPGGKS